MNIFQRITNKKNYLRDMFLGKYFPMILADRIYRERLKTSKGINWNNPRDLNEKINWLKFNTDTTEWSRLADKYDVRKFIEERGFPDILVKLYQVCDSVEDIDFNKLPQEFVLKTNNGSGGVWIIRDKEKECTKELMLSVDNNLKEIFGRIYGEPHYSFIKPKIIAEELLKETNSVSSSLVDYKIWCFNGQVFGTWACYDRNGYYTKTEWHDLNWKYRPEWSVFTEHYQDGKGRLPLPKNYDKMIEIAKSLSKGFPQVRIDLYNIDGVIYFGEMTFTSAGGYMNFYSQEALDLMGDMIILP